MDNLFPAILIILGLFGLIVVWQSGRQRFRKQMQEPEEKARQDFEEKTRNLKQQVNYLLSQNKNWFNKIEEFSSNNWQKFLIRLKIIALRLDRTITNYLTELNTKKKGHEAASNLQEFIHTMQELEAQDAINFTEPNLPSYNSSTIDYKKEELKLLRKFIKDSEDPEFLKNLVRWYLWRKDIVAARWALIYLYWHQEHKKYDKIIADLFTELEHLMESQNN
ncbi:MAG: hypothetical protein PHD96_01340 [Candidatus Pacebacteria bacterium]|nr:hypothetical protein [Candidatus Paceibacterota bacterium]